MLTDTELKQASEEMLAKWLKEAWKAARNRVQLQLPPEEALVSLGEHYWRVFNELASRYPEFHSPCGLCGVPIHTVYRDGSSIRMFCERCRER